jgi:hypothetical protein
MIKFLAFCFAIFIPLGMQTGACQKQNDEWVKIDVTDRDKSLVVYFNKGVTNSQIENFYNNVISTPRPDLNGYDLPPGVELRFKLEAVDGHEGVALKFEPNSTEDQRQKLKESIQHSPIVYQVLENTDPSKITKLEPQ